MCLKTLLNILQTERTSRAASEAQATQIKRSVPHTLSGPTHLLEAVLVPGIVIARIVTGEVGGMNLEQRETSLSAKGKRSQARPTSDPSSSLFRPHFSS